LPPAAAGKKAAAPHLLFNSFTYPHIRGSLVHFVPDICPGKLPFALPGMKAGSGPLRSTR
jgi:hypothetical protein